MEAADALLGETHLLAHFGKRFLGIHWIQKDNDKPQSKNAENKWKKTALNKAQQDRAASTGPGT